MISLYLLNEIRQPLKNICFFIIESHIFIGPPLPKPLSSHAMVHIDGDLVVIGGKTPTKHYLDVSSDLLRLSCSNGKCNWFQLPQKLQTPRYSMVAVVLPDDFLGCT